MRHVRRSIGCLLGGVWLLASCQATGRITVDPTDTRGKIASPSPKAAKAVAGATPFEVASAGPLAPPAAPTPAMGVANPLLRPSGAVQVLSGTVLVDAGYMVAGGGGNLIASDGTPIVAAGGGTLIGQGGSTLIGQGGSTLVGGDGASLAVSGGGNLIATLEANGFAEGRGSLVGLDGASLTGAAGAPIVAGGGGNYRLLDAGGPMAGTPLPAAGMVVRALTLGSNTPIALGNDAQGHPVYQIYSNLKGGFEVYLPATERGNVMLVASVPRSADPRQTTMGVTAVDDARPHSLDDRSRAVTRFFLGYFQKHFDRIITDATNNAPFPVALGFETEDKAGTAQLMWRFFGQLARNEHLVDLPPAERRRRITRAAGTALAHTDLSKAILTINWESAKKAYEGMPVVAYMDVVLSKIENVARDKLQEPTNAPINMLAPVSNGLFTRAPFSLVPSITIAKPGDVGEFVATEAFINQTVQLKDVWKALGLPVKASYVQEAEAEAVGRADEADYPYFHGRRVDRCAEVLALAIFETLFTSPEVVEAVTNEVKGESEHPR